MNKDELLKLQAYLRKTFASTRIDVRGHPKKKDMCEVYVGDEFLATITVDDEDGGRDYALQMSILEMDLEGL